MNERIIESWNELKALLAETEVDVLKNANGNASAGIRARKKLRELKGKLADLVKVTIEEGKQEKE